MNALAQFLALLVALARVQVARGWDPPPFCHGYTCPQYSVVSTNEAYEERFYDTSTWISTAVASSSNIDLSAGYRTLQGYLNGKNVAGKKVPVDTWPVAIGQIEVDGQKQISLKIFVPPGTDLPNPSNPAVSVEQMAAGVVYVRAFSGSPSESTGRAQLEEMENALTAVGIPYDTKRFIAAGYDSPMVLFGRHNEVWAFPA